MSEKPQSEEFDEEDEAEESVGASDGIDIENLIQDLDKRKRGGPKPGEPAWRRLERLREERHTAELVSDFDDYEIGDEPPTGQRTKPGRKRK